MTMRTMLKTTCSKHGVALLALAIALTGCPAPDSGTKTSADPDPQPTTKVDNDPGFTLKVLGPVTATIEAASFVRGSSTLFFDVHSDNVSLGVATPIGQLGYLAEASAGVPPAFDTSESIAPKELVAAESPAEHFVTAAGEATHRFYPAALPAHFDTLTFALGGVPATTQIVQDGYYQSVELIFPPHPRGALTVTTQDPNLHFQQTHETSDGTTYSYAKMATVPDTALERFGHHASTATLTVSVRELDGSPTRGLKAGNFTVPGGVSLAAYRERSIVTTVTETEPGRYRVVMDFAFLQSPFEVEQDLILSVHPAALEHEVMP